MGQAPVYGGLTGREQACRGFAAVSLRILLILAQRRVVQKPVGCFRALQTL